MVVRVQGDVMLFRRVGPGTFDLAVRAAQGVRVVAVLPHSKSFRAVCVAARSA
jgi:hypothetical protein